MTLYSEEEFTRFFEPYATNVDGFYEADYWRLSDEVIKSLVQKHLGVSPGQDLLDAGGGSGRWALWYSEHLDCRVTVADLSEHMLAQARAMVTETGRQDSISTVACDLQDAPQLQDSSFDALMSTYGVLSFLHDPAAAFRTFYRVLRPGAHGLLMSHSLTTALTSKVQDGAPVEELRSIMDTRTVRWADGVPRLRVFTPSDLAQLADSAGFVVVGVYGVTAVVMPGREDFGFPYNGISEVSRHLQDPEFFAEALRLEQLVCDTDSGAGRGVNLLLHVRKPAP
jgi:cyclopropane fatty-acyl-phospholipid synthase-like methyltransferase